MNAAIKFFVSPALPALLAGLTLLGTGCVSQHAADQWRNKYLASEDMILDLRAQLDDKEAELAMLRGRANPNSDLQAQIDALTAERDALQASLDEALAAMRNAAGAPLPTVLTSELERLAAANPNLMTFDPKTGMIRFRSDVTFALGRTDVQDEAKGVLGELASVLNSPAAQNYEVRVVGHTDNVPVRNAANVQKYEDNWGMSAFRAISVMRELNTAGVPAGRMSIAGYGQQRPIAPNNPNGTEANRRVEIFLVPMPGRTVAAVEDAPAPDTAGAVVPMDNPAPAESPAMFK